jgi:Glycosyl hydrolase family 79 C-terminal beta domain
VPRLRMLAIALALAAVLAQTTVARAQQLTATVGSTTTGQPMGSGFVGVSLEYSALHVYTGRDPTAVNPVLINLLRALAPGQAPVIRIGGNSADYTWWPMRGVIPPGGVRYALNAGWIRTTQALASALGARLIAGVNLASNRPALAAAEGRALLAGIGRGYLQALEIGNEPDVYNVFPWYRDRHKRPFFARGRGYNLSAYIGDFSRWRAALPRVSLAGPAVAELTWLNGLGRFLAAEAGLGAVTAHRYPFRACVTDPSSPLFASIPRLLSDQASSGLAHSVAPYVGVAHARGLPFRVDELNSASCSGKRGVSDTFASALWALDALFNMAGVGVDGVNLHSLPGARYELFTFSHVASGWQAFVHPEYYGLLMFAQAFPPGAKLLQTTADPGPVKVWATRGADGRTRVVLINKDTASADQVHLTVPGADTIGQASLEMLEAPGATSTAGVTLGGQTFGAKTTTGTLPPPQPNPVLSVAGSYMVNLPAGSAALLTQ